MKRILVISIGTLVLFALAMMVSVWRESQAPLTHTPSALETGRAQLQAQLEESKKTEAAVEQQQWKSPDQLRALIEGHEQRIAKLKNNKEAAAIVAYDRDSIERLQKRIAQIAEERAAQAEAATAEAAKEAAAQSESR
jgi:septal ring factor EnvC (AmiA/AmiB activator)